MNRTLSSAWTFTYKFVFPPFWIALMLYLVRLLAATPAAVVGGGAHGGGVPNPVWALILVALVGTVAILWTTVPLKRVRLEGGALVVSNYLSEWRVPASLITDVRQNRWIRTRPITVHLRSDVGCGTRIVFAPPQRWLNHFLFWREDREVVELRDLAFDSSAGWRSRLRAEPGDG